MGDMSNPPKRSAAEVKKIMSSAGMYDPISNPLGVNVPENQRGIQIYNTSQLISQTGRNQRGELVSWGFQQPLFFLSVFQRIDIVKLCSPIFGLVTSRMQRISGLEFNIKPIRKEEDRIALELKNMKSVYMERKGMLDIESIVLKGRIVQNIRVHLPEVMPDLSNFDGAMLRWKRKIRQSASDYGNEVKDWMMEPNHGVTWQEYMKKYVFDLMTHGAASVYKQSQKNKLENFDVLPGGTVYRMKNPYFSGVDAYVQIIPGIQPQIFYSNEMMYTDYLPISAQNYGMIPLEALINNVAEKMLFDKKMADQADGTKPPEKLIIITKNLGTMGDFDNPDEIPLDKREQKRIEGKLNQPQKRGIITMSGNDAHIVDLTGENTMDLQTRRSKDIREEVALVYNMSNLEINLTGSGDTSGRATSEQQAIMDQGKGIIPILKMIENKHTKEIIPFRFGPGYMMEFVRSKNEREELQLDLMRQQTGEETVNELRERKNLERFEGEEFDKPKGSATGQVGDELNPLFTKQVE